MPRPPRVYKTSAIVLRQRRLGDADKIVTLYSANFGKLDAVAKGVRRLKSRLAGHVEPLTHGSYLVARGRNLDIITQAQTIETFQPLRDGLDRLSRALYVAELVDRSTEERAENFAIYRLLLDTLRRLAEHDQLDLVVRLLEMALLEELGYRPELERCVVCGGSLAGAANAWSAGAGGVVCLRCQPGENAALRALSANALAAARLLQDGDFEAAVEAQLSPQIIGELERHLRDAIHHALDRDVRSAAFVDAVRRPRLWRTVRRASPR